MANMKRSRRVLITGGAGFVGAHLAQELAKAGNNVRVLDNFSLGEQRIPRILGSNVELIEGDLRNRSHVAAALKNIDVVYHLAASARKGHEIVSQFDDNCIGTANLLEQIIELRHEQKLERLIVASSSAIYGEGLYRTTRGELHMYANRNANRLILDSWEPVDENGLPLTAVPTTEEKCPNIGSVYALTKYNQEKMCLMVADSYEIPVVALRFFNIYGRGQGILGNFASRLMNDAPPVIFEDGKQSRDFVHIFDVLQACRLALDSSAAVGHAVNIGSGERSTVASVAEKIADALGKHYISPEITEQYRSGDVRHCFADINLAKKLLGFSPQIKLDSGIADLAEWLQSQTSDFAIEGLAV